MFHRVGTGTAAHAKTRRGPPDVDVRLLRDALFRFGERSPDGNMAELRAAVRGTLGRGQVGNDPALEAELLEACLYVLRNR